MNPMAVAVAEVAADRMINKLVDTIKTFDSNVIKNRLYALHINGAIKYTSLCELYSLVSLNEVSETSGDKYER